MYKSQSILLAMAMVVSAQMSPTDFPAVIAAQAPPAFPENSIPSTANPIRTIEWSQPIGGNLLANWSFENSQQFWSPGPSLAGIPRVRSIITPAHSGYFVGQASPGKSGPGLISEKVQLKAGQTYTLSLYYSGITAASSGTSASVFPSIVFYDQNKPLLQTVTGTNYPLATNWTEYKLTFTPPTPSGGGDCFAKINIITGTVPASFTNLIFDDVVLAEGTGTSPGLNRSNILTSISVADPTGPVLQSAISNTVDNKYLTQSVGYDNYGRAETQFLPYSVPNTAALSEVLNPITNAKSAWPSTGNTPFTQVVYPNATAVGQTQQALSGDAWSIGSSSSNNSHTSASGSVLVGAIPVDGSQFPNQPFETFALIGSIPQEMPFFMSWSRDPNNNYSVSWKDAQGQLLKTAKLLSKAGGETPNLWSWAITTYQYYENGMLKSVTAPTPTGSGSGQVPPTITSYDFQGRIVARSSPDEGLTRYWYDQAGRLRFWQTSTMSDVKGEWVAWKAYDKLGRAIKEGVCRPRSMSSLQTMAETSGSEQSYNMVTSSTYTKGWIYDNLNSNDFLRRTYVPLWTVLGATNFAGSNGQGRLVAKYNLNPFYNPGTANQQEMTTPQAKLVVEFYSYDGYGRPWVSGKYIGAVKDPAANLQSVEYRYDSASRLANMRVDRQATQAQAILPDGSLVPDASRLEDANYTYVYDGNGRVTFIYDNGIGVAEYVYDVYGRLSSVTLGDHITLTGTLLPLKTNLTYHPHGQLLTSITYADGKVSYLERLGYEAPQLDPVATGITNPDPSYTGQITQAVHQFGTDLNVMDPSKTAGTQTVKALNYAYDPAGRMTQVQTYLPNQDVTYASEGMAKLNVPFNTTSVLDHSATYTYDEDDRKSSVKWGSVGATTTFNYAPGSNRLDNVSGTIQPSSFRDASGVGNFTYDAAGRMISDKSIMRDITYGYDGFPVSLHTWGNETIYPLYDADGQMASYASTFNSPYGQGIGNKYHYFNISGFTHKEINESWTYGTNTIPSTWNSASVILNYRGQNSVVGRKLLGSTIKRQFFVKDHQGSTIRIVNDENSSTGGAFDYEAYGDVRTLKGEATNATQKYTGKEYFQSLGLTYFGGRWYDPQIGVWTSPDPMHQHISPYAFSNTPVNTTDPDGLWDDGNVCSDDASGDWWGGDNWSGDFVDASGNYASYSNLLNSVNQFNDLSQYYAGIDNYNQSTSLSSFQSSPYLNEVGGQNIDLGNYSLSLSEGSLTESSLRNQTLDATAFGNAIELGLNALSITGSPQSMGLPQSAGSGAPMLGDAIEMGAGGGRIPNGNTGAWDPLINLGGGKLLTAGAGLIWRAGEGAGIAAKTAYSVAFETSIPKLGIGTRKAHFKAANEALMVEMERSSEFAASMKGLGIEVPKNGAGTALGKSPADWTWHHVPDQPGMMQLVVRSQHQSNGALQTLFHPNRVGGFNIWGSNY
jgi:RHS repeat-associated protein